MTKRGQERRSFGEWTSDNSLLLKRSGVALTALSSLLFITGMVHSESINQSFSQDAVDLMGLGLGLLFTTGISLMVVGSMAKPLGEGFITDDPLSETISDKITSWRSRRIKPRKKLLGTIYSKSSQRVCQKNYLTILLWR